MPLGVDRPATRRTRRRCGRPRRTRRTRTPRSAGGRARAGRGRRPSSNPVSSWTVPAWTGPVSRSSCQRSGGRRWSPPVNSLKLLRRSNSSRMRSRSSEGARSVGSPSDVAPVDRHEHAGDVGGRSEARNSGASAQSSAVIGRPSGWLAPTDSPPAVRRRPRQLDPAGGHEAREGHRRRADGVDPDAERRRLDRHGP